MNGSTRRGKNRRYYNGVPFARTTICCSAVALTCAVCAAAADAPPLPPLALFPVRTIWTLALNTALAAPPAFSGTLALFPIEGDELAAYDLSNGSRRWTAATRSRSAPAIGDGLVFLAEPDSVTALSEEDGLVRWRLPFEEALAVPLVWDNGWLIAGAASGDVLAFRAVDGHLVWRRSIGARLSAAPALAADRIYLPTEDGRVVALRIDTGEEIWQRRLGGPANDILALEDRIYVGSDDNFFYCLRARGGEVDWRWRTGGDVVGRAAADEERVYFVSFDNVLRALDRRSGAQRWMRALPLRPTTGTVVAGRAVIVGGLSPTLLGYGVVDGTPAGEIAMAGEIAAPPHALDAPDVAAPRIVAVARDIAKGATVIAVERSVEPPNAPMQPLPNATMPAPQVAEPPSGLDQ
jgi:outer membrane protein assembly factor BamB